MTGEGDKAQKIMKWETRILKEKKRKIQMQNPSANLG
jgi:hypothetical protein